MSPHCTLHAILTAKFFCPIPDIFHSLVSVPSKLLTPIAVDSTARHIAIWSGATNPVESALLTNRLAYEEIREKTLHPNLMHALAIALGEGKKGGA